VFVVLVSFVLIVTISRFATKTRRN
jgi:hypothetical protein